MRRVALSALLAAASAYAPAAGAQVAPVVANLDGDPAVERVVPRNTENANGRAWGLWHFVLVDSCDGATRRYRLSPRYTGPDRLEVRQVDWYTRRPEVFFELRLGGGGHIGVAKVVRLAGRAGRGCPTPVTLFRYSTHDPPFADPKGFGGPVDFRVEISNRTTRYRGSEIRLEERYIRPYASLADHRRRRVTLFRFSPLRNRYVPYSTRVSRVAPL